MTISIRQARTLSTANEFKLVEASRPPQLKTHTLARLQVLIARARTQRDKYRDLNKRQRLALRERTGGKKASLQESNQRTQIKAALFAEVLERLQERQRVVKAAAKEAERRAKAAAKSKAAKSKATPKRKRVAGKAKAPAKRAGGRKARDRGTQDETVTATQKATGFLSNSAVEADRRQHLQNIRSKAIAGHKRAAGKRQQARRDARRA